MKQHTFFPIIFAGLSLFAAACGSSEKKSTDTTDSVFILNEKVEDVHSQSNFNQVKTTHLDLDITVDFDHKKVSGVAHWTIENMTKDSVLILDTDELQIDSIRLDDNTLTTFTLKDPVPYLGQALHINITPETKKVSVYYSTIYSDTDTFAALQWLAPEQTFNKKHPFLFTKSEPTMSRCWIPCQDAPMVKITYFAKITVPKDLIALMSGENAQEKNPDGVYKSTMTKPVPVYLMALVVGDVMFQPLNDNMGVYAESSILKKCAEEFSEVPDMVNVASQIIGPYDWPRYDLIVLPSGFPIGGMENPMFNFITPTIVAGDKSLVSLIAHELAHSWSGNTITNATWNDLWINEGFTVYFERRIMEAIRGKDYSDMLWNIGFQDLMYSMNKFGDTSVYTKLKLNLKGENAYDAFSDIAYEKGGFFLWSIEETVGRANFDAFIQKFIKRYAYKSLTTEEFIQFLEKELIAQNPEWKSKINYIDWIYNPGIPKNCPQPGKTKFNAVDSQRVAFVASKDVNILKTEEWTTHEWLHFIRNFDENITKDDLANLDKIFKLTQTSNSEIAAAWFEKAILKNYKTVEPALSQFLKVTGRQKFLEPLYTAMMKNPEWQPIAKRYFTNYRNNYHPIAQSMVSKIVNP